MQVINGMFRGENTDSFSVYDLTIEWPYLLTNGSEMNAGSSGF